MLTHADILVAFEAEYPRGSAAAPDGVFLVARLQDPQLAMADPTPHIFLPDCHLVPKPDAIRFPRVTASEEEVTELERFLRLLLNLKVQDPNVAVWHLGDLCDLWRTAGLGGTPDEDLDAIAQDRSTIFHLLRDQPNAGLGATILAGNHDGALVNSRWALGRQYFIPALAGPLGGHTLVIHGDQFDAIETLPVDIKEFFARGATEQVPPVARGMLEATNPHWTPKTPDEPLPKKPKARFSYQHYDLRATDQLPLDQAAVNVIAQTPPEWDPATAFIESFGGTGKRATIDPPGQRFFQDAAWWADRYAAQGRDVRLIVIGHTHEARIVQGKRADGTRLVLMDCGAWVGPGFLSKTLSAPILKAQVGVKVGDDLRIYQIGYRAAS